MSIGDWSNRMQLWTWHLPAWDITSQKRDLDRMKDAWGPETALMLCRPYEELHRRLETDQLIFCFCHYEHWCQIEIRKLWILEVPIGQVLKFTDSNIWENLLQLSKSNLDALNDSPIWERLFLDIEIAQRRIDNGEASEVIAILGVPIYPDWVVDSTRYNVGTFEMECPYNRLPTTISEAERYRKEHTN